MFKYHAIVQEDGSVTLPSLRAFSGREVVVQVFDAKDIDKQATNETLDLDDIKDSISDVSWDVFRLGNRFDDLEEKLDQILEKFNQQDEEE